mmetsp:Transcript_38562/g.111215  ORF Transcript_38562/g.111215 Transcript_38562/m.111215 type:complete len:301 (+) Transcript_38562:1433-2335(+)
MQPRLRVHHLRVQVDLRSEHEFHDLEEHVQADRHDLVQNDPVLAEAHCELAEVAVVANSLRHRRRVKAEQDEGGDQPLHAGVQVDLQVRYLRIERSDVQARLALVADIAGDGQEPRGVAQHTAPRAEVLGVERRVDAIRTWCASEADRAAHVVEAHLRLVQHCSKLLLASLAGNGLDEVDDSLLCFCLCLALADLRIGFARREVGQTDPRRPPLLQVGLAVQVGRRDERAAGVGAKDQHIRREDLVLEGQQQIPAQHLLPLSLLELPGLRVESPAAPHVLRSVVSSPAGILVQVLERGPQ